MKTQTEQWYPIYPDGVLIDETDTEKLCEFIFTQCFIPSISTDTDHQDQKCDTDE